MQYLHFYLQLKCKDIIHTTVSNGGDDLKTLRNTLGMTQEEVAELAGISLRSYKSYENEPQKKGTPIYKYILELLQKKAFVDEEHGILTLNFITDRCREVFSFYVF